MIFELTIWGCIIHEYDFMNEMCRTSIQNAGNGTKERWTSFVVKCDDHWRGLELRDVISLSFAAIQRKNGRRKFLIIILIKSHVQIQNEAISFIFHT
jgi:hypothetical protein